MRVRDFLHSKKRSRVIEAASFWRENVVVVVILLRRSFSESVVVAGTSYQMLEVLAFFNLESA